MQELNGSERAKLRRISSDSHLLKNGDKSGNKDYYRQYINRLRKQGLLEEADKDIAVGHSGIAKWELKQVQELKNSNQLTQTHEINNHSPEAMQVSKEQIEQWHKELADNNKITERHNKIEEEEFLKHFQKLYEEQLHNASSEKSTLATMSNADKDTIRNIRELRIDHPEYGRGDFTHFLDGLEHFHNLLVNAHKQENFDRLSEDSRRQFLEELARDQANSSPNRPKISSQNAKIALRPYYEADRNRLTDLMSAWERASSHGNKDEFLSRLGITKGDDRDQHRREQFEQNVLRSQNFLQKDWRNLESQ